jgi:hypothetical protein
MKYSYKAPEELNEYLLKEGDGTYVITAVCEEDRDGGRLKDRHGNDMIKIMLDVTDAQRKSARVNQFVTGAENMSWKIKQIAESVGMPELYNDGGNFNPQKLDGARGDCTIFTEPGRGEFGARSSIKKWLPAAPGNQVPQAAPDIEDDLPF